MHTLTKLLVEYGLPLVFLNVFAEQVGLPIPAVPTLVLAGALAASGKADVGHLFMVAVLASLLADSIWFALGRRHGLRILRRLCRVSLSPDSCVRQTQALFDRWGSRSLLVAKFVPGFSTVAPPLAGATRIGTVAFLAGDLGGAALWAGVSLGTGLLFHRTLESAVERLQSLGAWSFGTLLLALALYLLVKWRQRTRFYGFLRMARVSAAELHAMLEREPPPVVLDVRTSSERRRDPRRVPGATVFELVEFDEEPPALPPDREIVLYCT